MSGTNTRIPNFKIESKVRELTPFTNYNASIVADFDERGFYRIVHWNTTILEYDTNANRIISLQVGYISQTTSALLGRILRSLPQHAVKSHLAFVITKHDFARVRRMLRI